MRIRIATIAVIAGALLLAQFGLAQAQGTSVNTSRSNIKHGGEAAPREPGKPQQRRGGFIIPLVAKTDSGKPGKAGQGRVVSPRDAASGTPQNRVLVNTSRSNIKHGAQ